MSDEISQVVEMEYKGVYYLLKGSHEAITTIIRAIRTLSNWAHEKNLKSPGSSTWQKIQEVSEGTAPVIELPKEMFEKTVKNPKRFGDEYISPFEYYCQENNLRYCIMPDLNPNDDYIPIGVPSQDLAIHQKQMKSWMSIRQETEENKDKDYDAKIQAKREEIANAKTPEEKERLEGELAELVQAKEENKDKLEETKDKMSRDNTLTFEEYLRQGKGTNFEKDPEKALAIEPEVGIVREFLPIECMVPIRDEGLVPDSKELFYSQKTQDNELFTIKRTFEPDENGVFFSVYSVTDAKDPSNVKTFSDRGMTREAWMKKLPEMLKYAGMLADQPTTALVTEDRLKAYIKGLDSNFSKTQDEGSEEKQYSSKEAKEFVEGIKRDKEQADRYDESLYTTITVPAAAVMSDGEGKMSLELAGGLVSGAPVTSANKKMATLKINSDDIFEMKKPDGEVSSIKGKDIIAELTSTKSKDESKAMHHTARK